MSSPGFMSPPIGEGGGGGGRSPKSGRSWKAPQFAIGKAYDDGFQKERLLAFA